MEQPLELANQIAARLGQIEGVAAVVLGGSWARGTADAGSDLDLGIYYQPHQPPSLVTLRELAQELDDSHAADLVTDFGGWGPWINGGGWLTVKGRRVDWIYRDLALVGNIIQDCREGRSACYYQPGHPLGFFTHIYLGEIFYCRPLHDPQNRLGGLKELVTPYPPRLKQSLIQNYLWQAGFALDTSRKSAERGESFYVAGNLFRCAACLVQALFALNETYILNEKGSVKIAGTFARCPANFEEVVESVLAQPGHNSTELRASLTKFDQLVESVQQLWVEDSNTNQVERNRKL